MNDLFRNELRVFMNLFQPSVKLIRTEQKGSRKTKHYDRPQTPLDRLAAMPGADQVKVKYYLELRARLDPFELAAAIRLKLDRIWKLRSVRSTVPAKKPADTTVIDIARTLSRTLGAQRPSPASRTQTGAPLG